MNKINSEIDEDEIFSVLAHPIRRRILSTIFEFGYITFTTMSKDWGISTGTLYHHLKSLKHITYQNENNQYLLNDKGREITAWFLKTDTGKVTVNKIDSFTMFMNPLLDIIEKHSKRSIIICLTIIITGFYFSHLSNIIIIGPIIIQNNAKYSIFINVLSLLFIIFSIHFVAYFSHRKTDYLINGLLISVTPVYLVIIILSLLSINILSIVWIVLSILLQTFYLSVNIAITIRNGSKIEQSIITHILILYMLLFFSFQYVS